MTTALARKTLRDYRRALIGWTIGIGFWMTVYLPFYNQFSDNEDALGYIESLPEAMRTGFGFDNFLTGPGYVQAMVYNLYIPLMLIFCAALFANRAISGPEESGSLETLIALPFTRRQFVLGRFAAIVLGVVAVGILQWLLVVGFTAGLDIDVGVGNLATASLGLTLLGLVFGTLALAVGAATGKRSYVLGVTGGVALVTYGLNAFYTQAEALEPLRWLSPFYYYLGGDPLGGNFPSGYFLVLAGITVVLLAVALVTFDRRDVGT
jgi:ABC-2 type transport system permease protein